MTEALKREIMTHLTDEFFPCTAEAVEEYACNNMNDVSDAFFVWALELASQAEEDGFATFLYESVNDLFCEIPKNINIHGKQI